jgi:hypothetical protein
MNNITLATDRIPASQRMVWIPDPPEMLRQILNRVCNIRTIEVQPNHWIYQRMGEM